MAAVNYTLRLDESDKKAAEQVFNELGLTLAAGLNVYVKAVVRRKGIPFDLALAPSLDEKLTSDQKNVARDFLIAMQNIRKKGLTAEDNSAIDDLQNGKYKAAFEGN